MNILDAEEKAERLSRKHKTMAVVYSIVTDNMRVEYDACLEENYDGDEEDIHVTFSNGEALV